MDFYGFQHLLPSHCCRGLGLHLYAVSEKSKGFILLIGHFKYLLTYLLTYFKLTIQGTRSDRPLFEIQIILPHGCTMGKIYLAFTLPEMEVESLESFSKQRKYDIVIQIDTLALFFSQRNNQIIHYYKFISLIQRTCSEKKLSSAKIGFTVKKINYLPVVSSDDSRAYN